MHGGMDMPGLIDAASCEGSAFREIAALRCATLLGSCPECIWPRQGESRMQISREDLVEATRTELDLVDAPACSGCQAPVDINMLMTLPALCSFAQALQAERRGGNDGSGNHAYTPAHSTARHEPLRSSQSAFVMAPPVEPRLSTKQHLQWDENAMVQRHGAQPAAATKAASFQHPTFAAASHAEDYAEAVPTRLSGGHPIGAANSGLTGARLGASSGLSDAPELEGSGPGRVGTAFQSAASKLAHDQRERHGGRGACGGGKGGTYRSSAYGGDGEGGGGTGGTLGGGEGGGNGGGEGDGG